MYDHSIMVIARCCRDFRSPKEESIAPVNPLDDKRLEQFQVSNIRLIPGAVIHAGPDEGKVQFKPSQANAFGAQGSPIQFFFSAYAVRIVIIALAVHIGKEMEHKSELVLSFKTEAVHSDWD